MIQIIKPKKDERPEGKPMSECPNCVPLVPLERPKNSESVWVRYGNSAIAYTDFSWHKSELEKLSDCRFIEADCVVNRVCRRNTLDSFNHRRVCSGRRIETRAIEEQKTTKRSGNERRSHQRSHSRDPSPSL